MKTIEPTEDQVANAIFRSVQSSCMMACPRFTPMGWFECDVIVVTKAGFAVEYEIKRSRADFKKDADKKRPKDARMWMRGESEDMQKKHELLEEGSEKGPSRFFFVTPEGMVQEDEIPKWAGWMVFKVTQSGLVWTTVKKKAPRIHSQPINHGIIEKMSGAFYWRFWALRQSMDRKTKGK